MDLRLERVSHAYGALQVLDDVSFTVPSGRIVCIVGPSGCGKSTLLRLMGGLERPRDGAVLEVGALPVSSLNPLTFIFQDFALLPWRTVAGNVSLVLEDHGLARAERARIIADVLARTRLADFASAFPRQLSGGMKQRVGIARAFAVRPAVLLMDEPLSALDSQTRELLLDDLVGLWLRTPFTAVYVTHNLEEAVRIGHQVVVLSGRPGRVRAQIEIGLPLAERPAGDPEIEGYRRRLWELLRDDASAADSELIDA